MILEIAIFILLLAIILIVSFISGYFFGAYHTLKEDLDGRGNYD